MSFQVEREITRDDGIIIYIDDVPIGVAEGLVTWELDSDDEPYVSSITFGQGSNIFHLQNTPGKTADPWVHCFRRMVMQIDEDHDLQEWLSDEWDEYCLESGISRQGSWNY